MREITDDDVLETAEALRRELALAEDDRDAIVLGIQRLLWPPSPHYFLHDRPHVTVEIGQREQGGWQGRLRCPSGCGRSWTVHQAQTEEAVDQALAAAHTEYRSGRTVSVSSRPSRGEHRLALDDVLGRRTEYVEVYDQRLTPEEVAG